MEPVNPRLSRLIEAEAQQNRPPAGTRDRNWSAISAALQGPPPPDGGGDGSGGDNGPGDGGGGALPSGDGGASAASAAAPGAASATIAASKGASGLLPKLLLYGALGGGAAVTAAVVTAPTEPAHREEPVATATPVDAPETAAPQPAEPLAPETEPAPEDPPATAEEEPRVHSRRATPPPPPRSKLARELALIDAAETALAAGQLERVLELARRHASSFPDGALAPDRLTLQATALCRLGREDEGRAALGHLRSQWPSAPVSRGAMSACETEEPR